jgi:hypothetical protein
MKKLLSLFLSLLFALPSFAQLSTIIGLYGKSNAPDVTSYQYTRYMDPVIDVSKDAGALDNSQLFALTGWETDTHYWVMLGGQSAASIVYAPDGNTYENVDQGFLASMAKSNTVNTGWVKLLDVNSDPKPVFQPGASGAWDDLQVWPRAIIKESTTLKLWYAGQKSDNQFRVGYATSTDNGLTWTKSGSNPIYTDTDLPNDRILTVKVVNNGTNYIMFYQGEAPTTTGISIAQSADGITSWTRTHTGVLLDQSVNFICDVKYISGTYYLWTQRYSTSGQVGNGPSPRISLYTSTDLTTWTNLGEQLTHRGSQEWALGGDGIFFQKPNGNWFYVGNYVKNALEVFANAGEQFTGVKVAELNRSDAPIANRPNSYSYPSYVQRHYPLGPDFYSETSGFTEVITNEIGASNTGIGFAGLDFVNLQGSTTITYPGISINQTNFGVKVRVAHKLTGTHTLLKIGNDFWLTLESGKIRFRASSDGVTYQKDWISTVNVSEPSGIDYADAHGYISILKIGSDWYIFNDFVELTAGQITKTVDDPLTLLNNSGSSVLIGQNATIELRSVSILNGATKQQIIDLDI